MLNIYFHTCETFTCSECSPIDMVNNLITHLSIENKTDSTETNAIHIKMDRKHVDKVSGQLMSKNNFLRTELAKI